MLKHNRQQPSRLRATGFASAGVLALAALLAGTAQAEDFDQTARQLHAGYVRDLSELAGWCQTQGLAEQAKKTRGLAGPADDPCLLFLPVVPKLVGGEALPAQADAKLVEWDARLTRLRSAQSSALFELARRAIRGGRASLAYELLTAALYVNPDQETIRRMLGYQKCKGQWCSLYEATRLRAGQIWHPQYGWIAQAHLPRYQQGKRPNGARWIAAADDARQRQDIQSGWNIETEHYAIRTNHSLEAGAELGAKLERLYNVWQRLFLRYYASEAQVLALFEGKTATWKLPRHQVVFFRDKDDYVRSLRAGMPNIEITIGLYMQSMRIAYFFAGKPAEDRTLYHEATHQLFHESRPVAKDVGRLANFWALEGIAMYLESLREEQGFYVLGGFSDERMHAAAFRLLESKFYVPLSELTTYGMEQLQRDPRIATLYSQSAGLTHFLIHADRGRYRDAFVAYLTRIYAGRDEPGTLAGLTGVPYGKLDEQYRAFVAAGVQAQTARPASP